ncbi:unnamed protein product [Hermetia illucens]|uniref:Uncharacterized protein n=1 Tax=Hermetia illucens TaxID=343691 RepID=A0A7R8URP0_HERIL|nr:unnamed protein product [Hermetia illucens]
MEILRKQLRPGKVGIYSGTNDSDYNILQRQLLEGFQNSKAKLIKVTKIVKEAENKDELMDNKELPCLGLKRHMCYSNLEESIDTLINTCDTCNRLKVD